MRLAGQKEKLMKSPKTARTLAPQSHPLQVRLMNVEKALRSAVSLIDWASDTGNEPLDGMLAIGVIGTLAKCAAEVALVRDGGFGEVK
jgi:hypothetical protein